MQMMMVLGRRERCLCAAALTSALLIVMLVMQEMKCVLLRQASL